MKLVENTFSQISWNAFKPLDSTSLLNISLIISKIISEEENCHLSETEKGSIKSLSDILISREILIKILDILPIAVQIVDRQGIIQYINPAFLNIVGVNKEDRLGKSIFDVSKDGSLAKVIKTGKSVSNVRNHPNGSSTELVSSAAPIYYNGKLLGAIAVTNDIEEVLVLTKKLNESKNKLKTLSEKISNIASATYTFDDLIGSCSNMKRCIEMAKIASHTNATVLIQGETGTGKEVIANAIHNSSNRSKQPFISINCSAVPLNLLESELFGHEKGAFTGAFKKKLGKFELANEGTIFLDEIGDMDPLLQVKLLRALQERKIYRVGGEHPIPLNIRIISATNRNLKKMVKEGTFREDLFYRLNVLNIELPPLRDRKEDLPHLIDFIMKKTCRKLGKPFKIFTSDAMKIISQYNWPGNIRELENVLERVVISTKDNREIKGVDLKFISSNETILLEDT